MRRTTWRPGRRTKRSSRNTSGKKPRRTRTHSAQPPKQDLKLETLAEVMRGNILVHNHATAPTKWRRCSISRRIRLQISTFHHGARGLQLADRLAAEGVCGGLWVRLVGLQDGGLRRHPGKPRDCRSPRGRLRRGALRLRGGHSAPDQEPRRQTRGVRAGFEIPPERAIRWITANPAKALGTSPDRDARAQARWRTVVVWNGTPFSVYATRGTGVHRRRAAVRPPKPAGKPGRISRCGKSFASLRRSRCWCRRSAMHRTCDQGARVHTASAAGTSTMRMSWSLTDESPQSAAISPRLPRSVIEPGVARSRRGSSAASHRSAWKRSPRRKRRQHLRRGNSSDRARMADMCGGRNSTCA